MGRGGGEWGYTDSIPEIIRSYCSHHGVLLNFFAWSMMVWFFSSKGTRPVAFEGAFGGIAAIFFENSEVD